MVDHLLGVIACAERLETGIIQRTLYKQDWICIANRTPPRIDRGPTVEGPLRPRYASRRSGRPRSGIAKLVH